MFLAFSLSEIIKVPFGYLMDWLYQFTNNYGLALILFAVLVKIILFPVQAKSKKSMMKMSRLTPKMQAIQAKYAGDQQKQNEAVQALYREEGVGLGGGCLWSFIPLLILIPLYAVVRMPINYMLHESAEVAEQIIEIVKAGVPAAFSKNEYYDQMVAARYIPDFVDAIKEAVPTIGEKTLQGINFDFLGVDMGSIPTINVFSEKWAWDWAHIGGALIPLLSAGSQVLTMWISQKMNNSVVTNDKGVQDKEAADNSQSAQTNKMMMWTMPLMMLWIGFTVPVVLSLYWMIQGLVSVVQDVYLPATIVRSTMKRMPSSCSVLWKRTVWRQSVSVSAPSAVPQTPRVRPRTPARRRSRSSSVSWRLPRRLPMPRNMLPRRAS